MLKEIVVALALVFTPASTQQRLDDKPVIFTITNPADNSQASFACLRIIQE